MARLPSRGTPQRRSPFRLPSLVAAAERINTKKMRNTSRTAWQDEAWAMYDEVGELRFAANALASALSRARLYPAYIEDSSHYPEATENTTVEQVFHALGGGPLERAELLRRIAVHLFVPGDGYIVGIPPRDEVRMPTSVVHGLPPVTDVALGDLSWHALSVSEVVIGQGYIELHLRDGKQRYAEDEVYAFRVWRPHPRLWWEADSPVRANLPILRELVGLTKHISANIDSRLAGAGLLLVPDTIRAVTAQSDQPDDGGTGQDDPFVEALIESMLTPIRDRDAASAVVPLVATLPEDAIDKIKHITFATPFDGSTMQLREEAIRRLALGLDLPPEVLLGMGGANHWSAWQIEESTVKTHIEPVLGLICDAITVEYLRPALAEAGVPDPERYIVWFDTTELTLRPNRVGEAQSLHQMGILSDEAVLREAGFDETDLPFADSNLSPAARTAIGLVMENPGLIVEPGLAAIVRDVQALLDGTLDLSEPEPEPEPVEEPQVLPEEPPADVAPSGTDLPDTQGDAPDETVDVT